MKLLLLKFTNDKTFVTNQYFPGDKTSKTSSYRKQTATQDHSSHKAFREISICGDAGTPANKSDLVLDRAF